ncbi:MAG: BTAD domain-containing putative transcriptional regulator [Oscillospiraceae bacterium]
MSNSEDTFYVKFLGQFSISQNGVEIDIFKSRSGQLITLLQYLAANRKKDVSLENLTEVLWPEEASNPAGALKNLAYRARTALGEGGSEIAKNLIVSRNGSYAWNNAIPCDIDIEIFEKNCGLAQNTKLPVAERIEYYKTAILIYVGDFLSGSTADNWSISLNRYYHNLFFKSAYDFLALLESEKMYSQMQIFADKAIEIDQFEETAHQYLIKAYTFMGKNDLAINHYNFVSNLFYTELGVSLRAETTALYQNIFKILNNVEMDFDRIKNDIKELGAVDGALCCDYNVFKQLYRMQARIATRLKYDGALVLLTVTDSSGNLPSKTVLIKTMNKLNDVIISRLRVGDIFARFSSTQYIIMLQNVNEDLTKLVSNRLQEGFNQCSCAKGLHLLVDWRNIDPAMVT